MSYSYQNNLKRSLKRLLPPILTDVYQFASTLFRYYSFSKRKILAENCHLKDSKKGKRAFLLATGPSLKLENLELLAGEDCFSISNFYLHEQLHQVNPLFHFFAPYHKPMVLENYVEWLMKADEKLPPNTSIFLGHSTHEIVKNNNLFPKRKTYYLFLDGMHFRNCVDLTRPLLAPQTGPIMVFPVLAYMGYQEVYLLGCDQTVLKYYRKPIQNFYDNSKDMRTNATTVDCWTDIIDSLQASLTACQQYKFYQDLLQAKRIKTINLSQDSWLDFFEMDRLENIIKIKNQI